MLLKTFSACFTCYASTPTIFHWGLGGNGRGTPSHPQAYSLLFSGITPGAEINLALPHARQAP